jgi:hypothetical protein
LLNENQFIYINGNSEKRNWNLNSNNGQEPQIVLSEASMATLYETFIHSATTTNNIQRPRWFVIHDQDFSCINHVILCKKRGKYSRIWHPARLNENHSYGISFPLLAFLNSGQWSSSNTLGNQTSKSIFPTYLHI